MTHEALFFGGARLRRAIEMVGASGTRYHVEVQFFWDDEPKRTIRVVGSIDDGGMRAFMPLTESVLVSPYEHRTV